MFRTVSNGQSIHQYIPPDLQRMFYKNPSIVHASHNGKDPYGLSAVGLVLHLPLWALQNNVAFKSVDAYRYTCDVSGAFWTPGGHSFDNSDDVINLGSPATLFSADGTLEVMFYLTEALGVSLTGLIENDGAGVTEGEYSLRVHNTNGITFNIGAAGAIEKVILSDAVPSVGAWTHCIVRWGTGGMNMVVNNVAQAATDAHAGAILDTGADVKVGLSRSGANSTQTIINRVIQYDRRLTGGEVTDHYLQAVSTAV